MPAFTLKRFQQQALVALDNYLQAARLERGMNVARQIDAALP